MASYKIIITRKASKEIRKLPTDVTKEVAINIDGLSANPRPTGCKKLKGVSEDEYRIKVKKDYRILYTINEQKKIVDVLRVKHRKEVYRNL